MGGSRASCKIMIVQGTNKHESVYDDGRRNRACKSTRLCMQEGMAGFRMCHYVGGFHKSVPAHRRLTEAAT